ncbi:MAG: DNA helicase [Actinomycetota bacterium]|nr:MAG: DNA helicase [Actinomycetota bacterium]
MFDELSPEQRQAATHGDGPLLVLAGAGTGKTTTLAARVAHLLATGVPAERILLLTFSRRAAAEMLARAGQLARSAGADRVWGGTFHAVANRLLRLHGRAVGLPPDFTVLDQADAADVLDLIREELGFTSHVRRTPRKATLAAIYSRTVNTGERLETVIAQRFPWCRDDLEPIRAIVRAYTARKRASHLVDFDDLLLLWKALATDPSTRTELAGAFDHILVDEYQDTNAVQADILEGMRPPDGPRNLTVVGDDAQAIYGFRAATVRNILTFGERFPGARVIRLEHNRRSTRPIVEVANAVMAEARARLDKRLTSERDGARPTLLACDDERDQADAVCRSILEHRERGVALREQAVLFRTAHHVDLLEIELTRRSIPYVKYGGLRFLEAAHVKDALALLRICENPRDEVAWFRVLQLVEGVGPARARRLLDELGARGGAEGPVDLAALLLPDLPPRTAQGLRDLRGLLAACRSGALDVAAQLERIRDWLQPAIERRPGSVAARLADLDQLALLARASPSRTRFLDELTLDPPSSTSDLAGRPVLDEDWLVLSTIHSAKGLEWDVVHLIHLADGMFPSDLATGDEEEVEEERRLLYVAITRARHALHLYAPRRFHHRPRGRDDAHSLAQPSRFLTPAVRAVLEELAGDRSDGGECVPAITGVATIDDLLSELFG